MLEYLLEPSPMNICKSHVDKYRSRWHLCLSFCLFNVERLVINWRRALSFRGSGCGDSLCLFTPYALGAFFAGILAALSILWIKSISKLKEDAVIGFYFQHILCLGIVDYFSESNFNKRAKYYSR